MTFFKLFSLILTGAVVTVGIGAHGAEGNKTKAPAIAANAWSAVEARVANEGELAPLPEAKPLLLKIASVIDSVALKTIITNSRSLQMLRERVRTGLFHLNFKFEITAENYPYEPPFREPFPFRPTLEALEEVSDFLDLVEATTGFQSGLQAEIAKCPYFAVLKTLFPAAKTQAPPRAIGKKEMAANPVESYSAFQDRRIEFGEVASYPEFAEAVTGVLNDLRSDEVSQFRANDAAFNITVERALAELTVTQNASGPETRLQAEFTAPFPYRRTFQALMAGIMALDLRDRLKYPEGTNWHDVELSWFIGDQKKVLPLYHFNRYKYQLAGLLADPETVLLPDWGGAGFEYLDRLRVVPIGIVEMSGSTTRIDRHHNTPADNSYHDVNHVRRMRGYDQVKARKRGAVTREAKMEIYREQDRFVKWLMDATDPKKIPATDKFERNLRKHERVLIFETDHETALTPDRESLLQDLLRGPATPQPFEVQIQAAVSDLEMIRSFDGNLRSGADQLGLNFEHPTTIRYFLDRAPGYLANVHNKQGWGFFDSVFAMAKYMPAAEYRTPFMVATAALRLFARLGYENPPPIATLVKQIVDHSGQPELWNYFSYRDAPVVRLSGLNILNVAAAGEIQEAWRRNSGYFDRWKPTNASLIDGTIVHDDWSLGRYLDERNTPVYLREFYRIGADPATGEPILFEDLRNLPNEFLSNNHQAENLMSGARAVAVVDRLWHKELKFKNIDAAERWLVEAAQAVHQSVLDRNANQARNNPNYNVHWLSLPPANQINDLELIRIGFESRLLKNAKKIDPAMITMFREALNRLYRKIRRNEPIRSCQYTLTHARDLRFLTVRPTN